VGHNLKYDRIVLEQEGAGLEGLHFDTMVASYLVDPARRQHNLDDLAIDHLGLRTTTYEEVAGKGRKQVPFAEVPLEVARDYACEDTDVALRLREHFLPILQANELEPLFHALEMPLVPILARMERNGIRIDPAVFGEMNRRLERELAQIQHDIHVEAGGEFNINSVPQLREILFERLKLPVIKKTKTGASTDSDVLEALAGQGHRICGLMIEYRELEKLRNTYVDALPRMVNPGTGRIHTSFNQTVAQTGRLSSSDPNLQNIPIRTALGREIRRGFVADQGTVFLAADYSQVELRILAHFSGDEAFVKAFREGIDIHRQTASVLFDIPIDEVSRGPAGAGQDRELRDPLRPGGVLPGESAGDRAGGGEALHRGVLPALPRGAEPTWMCRWNGPGSGGTWRRWRGGAATSPSSGQRTGTCGSSASGWRRTLPSRGRRQTSSRRPCWGCRRCWTGRGGEGWPVAAWSPGRGHPAAGGTAGSPHASSSRSTTSCSSRWTRGGWRRCAKWWWSGWSRR
jgi:hypothetical protein